MSSFTILLHFFCKTHCICVGQERWRPKAFNGICIHIICLLMVCANVKNLRLKDAEQVFGEVYGKGFNNVAAYYDQCAL